MELKQNITQKDIYYFQKYTMNKMQLKKFLPLLLLILAAGIILLFINEDVRMAGALIILLDVALLIFLLALPKIQSKSQYKSRYMNLEYIYSFEDEKINIYSTNKIFESTYKISYKQIFEVIEIQGYFFLFSDEGQAYIIKTNDLDKHTYNSIKEKLSQCLRFIEDKNYKIKDKHRK